MITSISLINVSLCAQEGFSKLKLEEPTDNLCHKIERKLYLSSTLNKSENIQNYVDSIKACMGESSDFNFTIGKFYYNNNEYKASIKELNKVVNDTHFDQSKLGEAYYYLGLASYYSKNYDK